MQYTQDNAPIYEALVKYNENRVVPFDVPGHKHGKGNPLLTVFLDRKVHRSAINALIISGVIPVYVSPGVDHRLGIPLGMDAADVERAVNGNPEAKAVFVNNPTYYGICSDLKRICEIAHAKGMKVLADEAHGTHLYFGENMPVSAMAAGADMAAVSMHKTGGSLTQSSFLLVGKNAGISEGQSRG